MKNFAKSFLDIFSPQRLNNNDLRPKSSGRTFFSEGSGMRGGAKYPLGISGSGEGLELNHYRLRQNARVAYQETPQARSIIERYADTVVDVGLKLEATPKAELLGISQEQAEAWASEVEERFDCWAKSKLSHRSEINNFYQNQRLYQIAQQRDNDIFIRFYYNNTKDLDSFQISFLDADQIRGTGYTSTQGLYAGNSTDGIIRDERGREVAYKIWNKKETNGGIVYEPLTVPRIGARSKRIMMLHGFNPEYFGQTRGYSRLGFAVQELQKLTDFTSAQIQKAISQSMISLYTKPSKDNPASNPFEDIAVSRLAGPISKTTATPTPTASTVADEDTPTVKYENLSEAVFQTPGGVGVFNLMEGEDIKPFENKAPSDSFESFVNAFTSHLSAAASMPIEVLQMKFNQNYSASRATLILFWRVATIWRQEMASDFLNPTYEMWLSEEIAKGTIKAPGWSDPFLRQAWLANNWVGAPMPSIDPMRTAESDKLYVEMGAQTLDRVARNLNGSSAKSNRAKLKREFSELETPPWSPNANKEEESSNSNNNQKSSEDEDNA